MLRATMRLWGVVPWTQLSSEQYAVMVAAVEEAALVNVLDEWRARQLWAETGATVTGSDLDEVGKSALIPRFASAVRGLVDEGWLEVREHRPGHVAQTSLTGDELDHALMDPDSWIGRPDLNFRQLWLNTTGRWDELVNVAALDDR